MNATTNHYRRSQAVRWLLLALAAIAIGSCTLALTSCVGGTTAISTAAPKPVHSSQASFSGNKQNSGLIKQPEPGEEGFAVNQDWVDAHDTLLERFGSILYPPRKKGDRTGIVVEGDHYRITDQVLMQHDRMNAARRASLKP